MKEWFVKNFDGTGAFFVAVALLSFILFGPILAWRLMNMPFECPQGCAANGVPFHEHPLINHEHGGVRTDE